MDQYPSFLKYARANGTQDFDGYDGPMNEDYLSFTDYLNKSLGETEINATTNEYQWYSFQVVFFKDEYSSKNKYHIKQRNVTFINHKTPLEELKKDDKRLHGVLPRGNLESFLNLPKDQLPKVIETLPIMHDLERMKLLVIINQKDMKGVPRLYYNDFGYKDFKNNWKFVELPPNYRYNAFIPKMFDKLSISKMNKYPQCNYSVIAEPFRNTKIDKTRGPSFAFELNWDKNNVPYVNETVI